MSSTFSANSGSLERLKVRMQLRRLQPMRLPQALHGAQADADGFGHGAAGPMRGVAGRFGGGGVHNGDDLGRKRSAARLARPVAQQAFDTLLGVSRLPAPDRGSAGAPRAAPLPARASGRPNKGQCAPAALCLVDDCDPRRWPAGRSRSWAGGRTQTV